MLPEEVAKRQAATTSASMTSGRSSQDGTKKTSETDLPERAPVGNDYILGRLIGGELGLPPLSNRLGDGCPFVEDKGNMAKPYPCTCIWEEHMALGRHCKRGCVRKLSL